MRRAAFDIGELIEGIAVIGRLLLNLIGSAIKFTDQGEVALVVSSEVLGHVLEALTFEMCDTGIGIGIEPDQLPRLFEPFHQADASLSRRHPGGGLGLSIVKRLVKRMQVRAAGGSSGRLKDGPVRGDIAAIFVTGQAPSDCARR